MTWNTRTVSISAAIGATIVGLQLAAQVVLTHKLSPNEYASWALLVPLCSLVAGLVVVWCGPRGFAGASVGAFMASVALALLIGGSSTEAFTRAFNLAGPVALGELLGFALRLNAAKRARA